MSSFASLPTVNAAVGQGQPQGQVQGQTTTTSTAAPGLPNTADVNNSAIQQGMSQPPMYQNGGSMPPVSMGQGYGGVAPPVSGMAVHPGMSYQPPPQQPLLWGTNAMYIFNYLIAFIFSWMSVCVCERTVMKTLFGAPVTSDVRIVGLFLWDRFECQGNVETGVMVLLEQIIPGCLLIYSLIWFWKMWISDVRIFLEILSLLF